MPATSFFEAGAMATSTLAGRCNEFETHAEELREYGESKRGAKQLRDKLVRAHGEFLAKFATQSLTLLPREHPGHATSSDEVRTLSCACEAVELILLLRAFPSPAPEKLCYNVAARCYTLRASDAVLKLIPKLVSALRKGSARGAVQPPRDGAGELAELKPLGSEGVEGCSLAVL